MTKANHHFRSSGASPKFHELPSSTLLLSDGVKSMTDATKSNWLLKLIDSYQSKPEVKRHAFLCWELLRCKEMVFDIIASDSYNHIVVAHQIPFTSFPYDSATLWLVKGCIILPSEFVNCHMKPSIPVDGISTNFFITKN